MKPILVDEFVKQQDTSSEFTVDVNGTPMKGWQIAKPLNYDSDYISKKDRKEMAKAVLAGKAIAVCFFEDLSEDEKSKYVVQKIELAKKYENQTLDTNTKSLLKQ